ncbi:hypothetical protein J3R30DRAFT_3503936 [Lentinula aciculospora]|uniref:Uncharacterized protein n=1 Tax=Lentinula aciculospora TaxID=153920 RepID=A0A9W9A5I5_9AGAR|nr:hypothetical protein J3R30DRAFT_3503936 [Lentinula aciculospora]
MKFASAFLTFALGVATGALASPLSRRDTGPSCTIVVTPADGTDADAGKAAYELVYGFLVRMEDSTYPDGTTVSSISLNGPTVTDNGDGSFNAVTSLIVDGLTSGEISDIITEQWPGTWVWSADRSNPGYNWYMESTTC